MVILRSIFLFLFLSSMLASNAQAASQHPTNDLFISIDLAQSKMTATANITIPAEIDSILNLQGLEINAMSIDGVVTEDISNITSTPLPLKKKSYAQKIVVEYSLTCAETSNNQCLINNGAAVLTGSWHPFLNIDTIFNLTAQIPLSFSAISEADEIKTTLDEAYKTVIFFFPHPVRTINFIAGPYQVEEEVFGDNQKLLSYFFPEDQKLAASYRQKAKEYLESYIDLIGPYPYQRFAIVENRLPTGYAMPTFTLLGQSVVRLPFIVDTSLGHEVLHSWFGNAIRADRNSGNWSEGLTTYLADQSFAAQKGKGLQYRKSQLVKYQSFVKESNEIPIQDFVGANLSQGRQQQAIRAIGYGKTAMFFHMLHEKYGHDLFVTAIRDFYSRMNGKIAKWRDIQYSFENTTSCELYDLFHQWLTRKDVPILTVKDLHLEENNGQLQLTFTLHQGGKTPYNIDVPLLIKSKNQKTTKTITISETDTPVEIPLNYYPEEMIIDPDYDLIRQLTSREMPPVWRRFAGSEKSLVVVSSPSSFDLFEPLIDMLEAQGSQILAADEVTDQEIIDNDLIFLGTSGAIPRGLFGPQSPAPQGFSIDIRTNPLNPAKVAILANSTERQEVEKGMNKLRHYGKYSFLHFKAGHTLTKKIRLGEKGQHYPLDVSPIGIPAHASLSFDTIINSLDMSRVVYVGEAHTRYEDHKLQLRIIRELFNNNKNLAIGMEMFPRSAQQTLDQFINGDIDEKLFLKESDYFKVWSFDYRLYRDILNFARLNKIRIIALNIDRAKVSKVYKEGGISSLSPEEKMAIPINRDLVMPNYRDRIEAVFSMHPNHGNNTQFAGFFQAQAIWDETMAESIANYLSENPTQKMVVLAGKAHVIKGNAIPPRVARRLEVTQSIVMSADGNEITPPSLDFVIFSPPANLPPLPLIGISMHEDKEKKIVSIDGLSPHGQAKKLGIKKDDILVSIDGEPITTITEVKTIMLFKKKGDHVTVEIIRPHSFFADEKLTFEIDL